MYVLRQFGDVVLPDCSMSSDMGSYSTVETGVQVAGGYLHDTYGTEDAPSGTTVFTMQATMEQSSPATLETAYRALLAMRGKYKKLYRTWDSGGDTEWAYARLRRINAAYRHLSNAKIIAAITATFEMRSPHWNGSRHGDGWTLDSGEYLDTGLVLDEATGDVFTLATSSEDITVNNGGNVAVTDVIIEIEQMTVTAITQIEIQKYVGVSWVSLFTLAASTSGVNNYFKMDFGAKTIQLISLITTDEYGSFTIGASNPYENWFKLDPGDNELRILKTGGGATDEIRFTFNDGWA